MPAPSPITNPSRSRSHGREARSGVIVETGRERPRRRESGDADPAHRRLGAAGDHHVGIVEHDHPRASPMACAPVAQAVTTEWLGPLKP